MTISNGKLILGLITFMAYYFNGSSDPFATHLWRLLNYCALAGIDYYKKVFFIAFSQPSDGLCHGWHLWESSDIVLKDELSFFFFRSLWRGLLLCVVTDPPALGGLRAPLTTLSPISYREAGVLQMQQLFQKQKMKRVLKSFSQFRARKCLRTLSVNCNTTCLSWLVFSSPAFSDLFLFFSPPHFSPCVFPACSRQTYINILTM